jgi:hypothetical protein
MPSVTWLCPRCGRRVPNREALCHCGASREEALAAPAPSAPVRRSPRPPLPPSYRFSWRALPRDLKFLAVVVVLVVLGGLVTLFAPRVPWQSKPVPPLLGWSEPPSPRPKPTPTARAARVRPSPRASPSPSPGTEKKSWWPF